MATKLRIVGNFETFVKPYVTINRPMPSVKPRGVSAAPEIDDRDRPKPFGVRMPVRDKLAIDQAAKLLDVTRAEFIRWCAVHCAHDILKQHNEYMKQK